MLTALVRLHDALQAVRLPLDVPEVEARRTTLTQLVDQLEDYVLPRQMSLDAPLLAVVGGSTGAGKSTLVNTLVGRRVTASGLLRPTTRSPVLVHHPDDAQWFGQDRLLPDLVRVDHSTDDRHSLQLVASDTVPAGLAILDAPDVDSVEEDNRRLAAQLLAAGDLWLFVTSAARYSDQVPWEYLKRAAERSTAVAIVLDRTPADAVETVAAHLARMLASRGLKDSPLFTVNEAAIDEEGLLPAREVADVRAWLESLADDSDARSAVVRQTLDGTVRTLARQAHVVADAVAEQVVSLDGLRQSATTAYDDAEEAAVAACSDGSLLRGEVLGRWRELVGTGELLRSLEQRAGRIRDRLVSAVKGTAQQADRVSVALESALELMVLDQAERGATAAYDAWSALDHGKPLLAADPGLGRASTDLRRRAEAEVRAWQATVAELVKAEGPERRTARYLAYGVRGLSVTLIVLALSDAVPTHEEDSGVGAGRGLLEAVYGSELTRDLVSRARADLERRVRALLAGERDRYLGLLEGLAVPDDAAQQVRAAARRVDDRRYEQARPDQDLLT
ncbi:dynamin family protein [Nocardioides mangrovi]|uniref:Dynamin family protein n=1 Tax=Nocardioides mangrovi TaxID=2874580 RepID=A0ABS7U8T3_9ACTN|nr:dynamin family protein [Nocardioides mangrovi]MBZ5737389.1 dynamin family protein [Nocardioides mangrovi]